MSGALALLLAVALPALGIWGIVRAALQDDVGEPVNVWLTGASVLAMLVMLLILSSLTVVSLGDTLVTQFFGRYLGTIRKQGLLLTVPLTTKKKVSVKVRNFETNELKVNDADGNPVNIAAIVVWQVADTAKSVFAVEAYENFVTVLGGYPVLREAGLRIPDDIAVMGFDSFAGIRSRSSSGRGLACPFAVAAEVAPCEVPARNMRVLSLQNRSSTDAWMSSAVERSSLTFSSLPPASSYSCAAASKAPQT